MTSDTRESIRDLSRLHSAIIDLATRRNISSNEGIIALISEMQAGAAVLKDEETIGKLARIKGTYIDRLT